MKQKKQLLLRPDARIEEGTLLNQNNLKQEFDAESNERFLDPPISPVDTTNLLDNSQSIPWYLGFNAVVSCTCVALFLDMLSYSIILPIFPIMITQVYNLSPDYLGILFGSYAFGLLIATPIFGFLSDKYQKRKIFMLIGYIGLMLSSLFFMLGTAFTHLLVARFLAGVSGGASWTIGLSVIGEIATDNLGNLLGTVLTYNFIGFLIGNMY
eukprot:NODE_150_length_17275_cov_0.559618.p9 type:complete len:211 gc:universal NODE_150_length_17275_cov_0.559618:13441-12809(-)